MDALQRIRLTYSQREELRQASQREIAAAWAEALGATGIVLAHKDGQHPAARIAFAARLPAGATSDCEIADIETGSRVCDDDLLLLLPPRLPAGLQLLTAREVGRDGPSLPILVRWSEYLLELPDARSEADVRQAIEGLLSAETLPWEQVHEKRTSRYDLRTLMLGLDLEESKEGTHVIRMRLRHTLERAGRPDQVALALGFSEPPARLHRTRLFLAQTPAIVQRYREQAANGGW